MTSATGYKLGSLLASPSKNVKVQKDEAGKDISVCENCDRPITAAFINDGTGEPLWRHNFSQMMSCKPFDSRR